MFFAGISGQILPFLLTALFPLIFLLSGNPKPASNGDLNINPKSNFISDELYSTINYRELQHGIQNPLQEREICVV